MSVSYRSPIDDPRNVNVRPGGPIAASRNTYPMGVRPNNPPMTGRCAKPGPRSGMRAL